MENLTIISTLIGTEELLKSGYALKQADNFGRNHSYMSSVQSMDKYKPTYYITKADPKYNYGLDFEIYASYTADGINFLMRQNFGGGCSITNGGLRRVMFQNNEILFGNEYYDKSSKHRSGLRKMSECGWIFA